MTVKRKGMLEVGWKKKALTLMMEMASLFCTGR
jgi:hypothetical protein